MIELYFDEAYGRQNAAWFWRGTNDTPDDPAVGPFRSKDEAENAARLYYRSIGEGFPGLAEDPNAEPPQPIDDGSCDPLYGQRMDSADCGEC